MFSETPGPRVAHHQSEKHNCMYLACFVTRLQESQLEAAQPVTFRSAENACSVRIYGEDTGQKARSTSGNRHTPVDDIVSTTKLQTHFRKSSAKIETNGAAFSTAPLPRIETKRPADRLPRLRAPALGPLMSDCEPRHDRHFKCRLGDNGRPSRSCTRSSW